MTGLYQLPWDFNIGASLTGRQGYPEPFRINASTLANVETDKNIVLQPVGALRFDNVYELDLRAAKDFRVLQPRRRDDLGRPLQRAQPAHDPAAQHGPQHHHLRSHHRAPVAARLASRRQGLVLTSAVILAVRRPPGLRARRFSFSWAPGRRAATRTQTTETLRARRKAQGRGDYHGDTEGTEGSRIFAIAVTLRAKTGVLMSDAHHAGLLEALLDSWDRNNAILLNMLRALPEGGLEAKAMESSPSVAAMFTHIHYVRLVLVLEDAPEFAREVPAQEWVAERDAGRIAQMLTESAQVVRGAVEGRVEAGREMDTHYDHPILLLQHLLWHEAYHHGQLKLALKVAGHAMTDEQAGPLTWGVWMGKR